MCIIDQQKQDELMKDLARLEDDGGLTEQDVDAIAKQEGEKCGYTQIEVVDD